MSKVNAALKTGPVSTLLPDGKERCSLLGPEFQSLTDGPDGPLTITQAF